LHGAPASETEFTGTQRFRIVRSVGRGGMGEVYEAVDREHDARVALKLLTTLTPDALLLFKNEFRALRDIEHPNVVHFGELLEDGGRWFFTMEFVDGVDFLAYVRPGGDGADAEQPTVRTGSAGAALAAPESAVQRCAVALRGFDEGRLREALRQTAAGLAALHAAGKVHRDIKPSNVRVTGDGRVVLLDFGLVTDLRHENDVYTRHSVVGTPAFMAPEQVGHLEAGPESDWYSVGVMLFLALTGRLPFGGGASDVLVNKQLFEPPPPHAIAPDVPPDLDDLCVALLHTDPQARATHREIVRVLSAAEASPAVASPVPFVGRAAELARLEGWFEQARAGRPATVRVHGESGVGKSALLHAFARRIAERGAIVLAARCYESELVPFKAVDGVVDALSQHLVSLPAAEAAELTPPNASLLTQTFPVLRRVRSIAAAGAPLGDAPDPQEARGRAFAALRELFCRLARTRPLAVAIDDMQWSDADSLALLRELVRPPDAPALLLVLTIRDDAARGSDAALSAMPGVAHSLDLERLPLDDARSLATQLLRRFAVPDAAATADALAHEAGGHPLFLEALARHTQSVGAPYARLALDDALWQRVRELDADGRRVLQLVAVAAAPVTAKLAAHAATMDFADFSRRASGLRVAHLLRWSDADRVEPYHDRVRAVVLAHLDPADARAHHRCLALALEALGGGDPEALAVHWRGGGDDARALAYALKAAELADRALAFDRAAQMYRLALELGLPQAEATRVRVLLGDALQNAGRGADAAHTYLTAAEGAAKASEHLDLRRRAAEQLLIAGHVDEGLAVLGAVLDAVGMPLQRTPVRALASLLLRRAQLRLRGLRFEERAPGEIAEDDLARIDVSWSAAIGLSMIDNVRSADFQTRNLLHALGAGEPSRIARALCVEGAHSSIAATRTAARTTRLFDAAEDLARRTDDPYAQGLQRITSGTAAYLGGRWRRARELSEGGEAILRARCTGVVGEINSARLFAMSCMWFLGDLRELVRRVPISIAEAEERGDLYSQVNFRTGTNQAWLVMGALDEARRQVDEAMASWSHRGVHMQHFFELFARAQIDLYAGDGAAAYARAREGWGMLGRALILRIEYVRVIVRELLGRAAIAAAREVGGRQAARLLDAADRDARAMARVASPWAAPASRLVAAGVAASRGRSDEAIALLREAAAGLDGVDMAMHAAVARWRLGALLGGDEGAALVRGARAWLEDQGVQEAERFAAMLAPV